MTDAQRLIDASLPFMEAIRNLTAGTAAERWLNEAHGPRSPLYATLAALVEFGVRDGWAAHVQVGGARHRRSRICAPSAATHEFSITTVYMDSTGNDQGNPEGSLRGDYHAHPYGEFNMVVPVTDGAALADPNAAIR